MEYRNLKAEMLRENIKTEDIASLIKKTYGTAINKINGKTPFVLDEAIEIHNRFFSDVKFDYLFKRAE